MAATQVNHPRRLPQLYPLPLNPANRVLCLEKVKVGVVPMLQVMRNKAVQYHDGAYLLRGEPG
jgi:hypothetical protein